MFFGKFVAQAGEWARRIWARHNIDANTNLNYPAYPYMPYPYRARWAKSSGKMADWGILQV